MSKHGRVLVAMSGGVDSAITAILLHEQGYQVVGITMKTWSHSQPLGSRKETGCCTLDDINDARSMALKMGFNHYIIDIRNEFGPAIIDDFVSEYLSGRTPNPCILCNTHIKWEALLKRADKMDCEFIATGHYAKKKKEQDRYFIQKGVDKSKDQSYVLWGLSQKNLARTLLPLGTKLKKDIRALALDKSFESLAKKKDSYEICFVPDNNYKNFLLKKSPELKNKLKKGVIKDPQGNFLGYHEGYPFYTIGQRKGIGIAQGVPMYVKSIDADSNTLVVSQAGGLLSDSLTAHQINLMKYATLPPHLTFSTKIRYRDQGTESHVAWEDKNLKVTFNTPVKAVTPGQSVVIYEQEDVVAGGFIIA